MESSLCKSNEIRQSAMTAVEPVKKKRKINTEFLGTIDAPQGIAESSKPAEFRTKETTIPSNSKFNSGIANIGTCEFPTVWSGTSGSNGEISSQVRK